MGERIGTLTLVGVAALGLTAEPREPFAKQRPDMSAEEIAAVFQQNLRVLMFANADNIDSLAIHLQAENIKRARFRSRPFATTDGLARALADVTASRIPSGVPRTSSPAARSRPGSRSCAGTIPSSRYA